MFENNKKYWVWFGIEPMILERIAGELGVSVDSGEVLVFDRFYVIPGSPGVHATLGKSETQIRIKEKSIIATQEFYF